MNSKGLALIINLIVIAVFAMLGTVIYSVVRYQLREVIYEERLAQSLYIAEAGLEDALYEIYENPSWAAGFQKKPFANGYYTVTVSTDSPPYVTSAGYAQSIAFVGRPFTAITARAAITYSTGNTYGLMANTLAEVDGPAVVDAYNPNINVNPSYFDSGGGLWSNFQIKTTAGAAVNGDVSYYYFANIAANTVFGSVIHSTYTLTLPNHTCGSCKTHNDNQTITGPSSCYKSSTKALTVGNGITCTMKTGTYYLSNITVNGTLKADTTAGGITIYFNGAVNASGNCAINNLSKIPSRLLFYGEQTGKTHSFACSTPLHAYLEEKAATWLINGPLYGRVWGNNVRILSGGDVHVDTGGLAYLAPSHVAWARHTWSHGRRRR